MRRQDSAPHPGTVLLLEFLRPAGISGAQLARHLGVSPQRIGALLRGERPLTVDLAQRLEAAGAMRESYRLRLHYAWARRKTRLKRRDQRIAVLPALRRVSRDVVAAWFPAGFDSDDDCDH